jgi:fermentation-respiration switch protein FrsA (DUF1100 family)
MFVKQESFVFFPSRDVRNTPASAGMPFEEARLRTSDGLALGAWWVPAQNPRGALVFAHGNAGNLADRLDQVSLFRELGLSVLIFDYRGYGKSEGEPSEEGTYRDMEVAVGHVLGERGVPQSKLLYYGESLGCAVAVKAAVDRRPGALILESAFTSVAEMAAMHYPWLPVRWLLRIRYDSLSRMGAVGCPVLVLHSPEDEIVPCSMGERLFAAAPGPKRFARLTGGHNDGGLLVTEEARTALGEFLDEVLGGVIR